MASESRDLNDIGLMRSFRPAQAQAMPHYALEAILGYSIELLMELSNAGCNGEIGSGISEPLQSGPSGGHASIGLLRALRLSDART